MALMIALILTRWVPSTVPEVQRPPQPTDETRSPNGNFPAYRPIHIGAALLGHASLQTTRGYVAVFDEDVVRHYQLHLTRRRQLRPAEEYRDPTGDEWQESADHFDKRRVELGTCGRPYGSRARTSMPACAARCFRSNPGWSRAMDEIESDLHGRRQRPSPKGGEGRWRASR